MQKGKSGIDKYKFMVYCALYGMVVGGLATIAWRASLELTNFENNGTVSRSVIE